jgi:peptidoglycan lytic transglycosylase
MSNNIMATAVLVAAALIVTATTPASAQTFQERWSPIPKANAAEQPPREQDQTLRGNRPDRSQQQIAIPPERSYRRARVQQRSAPVVQHAAHPRGVIVGKASFYSYAGGKTASGRPFHRAEFTAASRLPFSI